MSTEFLTTNGMPVQRIQQNFGYRLRIFESTASKRAERSREMVLSGIAVVRGWFPVLKQWKVSGTNNPVVLLTRTNRYGIDDHNLDGIKLSVMAAAGISYTNECLLPLTPKQLNNRFVEVRLDTNQNTIFLFDVHYPRGTNVNPDKPAPDWVIDRTALRTQHEKKQACLLPRYRKELAVYKICPLTASREQIRN